MRLSIIVPAYNEASTVGEILDTLRRLPFHELVPGVTLDLEVVVVDDGSTDATADIVERFIAEHDPGHKIFTLLRQPRNYGKGRAVREGFHAARGDLLLIQDADLEYDPAVNYRPLLTPFFDRRQADVVYGSRFLAPSSVRPLYFWHLLGNRFLTFLTNLCTGLILTDMETGYKVFRRSVVEALLPMLRADDFGFEPEVTIRVARGRYRLFEIPITYTSRTYGEGKKIGWRDGLKAVRTIVTTSLFDRSAR